MNDPYEAHENEQAPPKPVWLTTKQVREKYGIDPLRFIVPPGEIKSKLMQTFGEEPTCFRVWLEDSVKAKASTK